MSFHLSVSVVSSCWNMNDNLCLFFFSFQEHHQSDVIVFSAPHVSRCVLSTCLITGNLSLDRLVEKGICEISALKGTIPPWWLVRVLWGHMLREVGGPSGALRLGDGHEGGGAPKWESILCRRNCSLRGRIVKIWTQWAMEWPGKEAEAASSEMRGLLLDM